MSNTVYVASAPVAARWRAGDASAIRPGMKYVLIDDSPLKYDGYWPLRRALGGAEKAVGALAGALAERGHEVQVVNNTSYPHMSNGAWWTPLDDANQLKAADVVVALRKPALLGTMRSVKVRILWVMGAPDYLVADANAPLWDSFKPGLMFVSEAQRRAYTGKLPSAVVSPGVREPFFNRAALPAPAPSLLPPPPTAVVTSHPLHGLAWLLDLWQTRIHPKMPSVKLSIFSASLGKGLRGEPVPADIAAALKQVAAAAPANVTVANPISDDGMAMVYRTARVHLYPGHEQDFACWTLAESQAAGLPAVARPLGGAAERIANGQSGFIVPDAEAFANVTMQILGDDGVHRALTEGADQISRRRTWPQAAEELDAFVAGLSGSA